MCSLHPFAEYTLVYRIRAEKSSKNSVAVPCSLSIADLAAPSHTAGQPHAKLSIFLTSEKWTGVSCLWAEERPAGQRRWMR